VATYVRSAPHSWFGRTAVDCRVQIRRARGRGIRNRRHRELPPAHRAREAQAPHQARHRTAGHGLRFAPELLPDFPDAVDLAILPPHAVSRQIVGCRASTSLRSDVALMRWSRRSTIARSSRRSRWCTTAIGARRVDYLSIRYTERLAQAGIEPSARGTRTTALARNGLSGKPGMVQDDSERSIAILLLVSDS
jgi:hypothetical protein